MKLNYYDVEKVTICPYCGHHRDREECSGCCGESSGHFEDVYETVDGETYPIDEVKLYRPIIDIIKYELNPRALRQKYFHFRRNTLVWFAQRTYDGPKSTMRKLRTITSFRWSALDRYILEKIWGYGFINTKSPEQWAVDRKESVKRMRAAWAKGELLGCDLYPKINEGE